MVLITNINRINSIFSPQICYTIRYQYEMFIAVRRFIIRSKHFHTFTNTSFNVCSIR